MVNIRTVVIQLIAVATLLTATSAQADAVGDAYRLCSVMDGTELTTQCEVHGWGETVDVTIDTNGAEARKMCAGIVNMIAQKTRSFKGQWKLQIFSPYSGERPIATCMLD